MVRGGWFNVNKTGASVLEGDDITEGVGSTYRKLAPSLPWRLKKRT